MITRRQFESACKALATKYGSILDDSLDTCALAGWTWHDEYPYGYLARTKQYSLVSPPILTEDEELLGEGLGEVEDVSQDIATAPTPGGASTVISQQYIVFSPTFQVPAFYFTIHHTTGTPLSLDELMRTPLFRFDLPEGSEANGYALTLPDAPFPLLSQGDHPTLGTPCWYLHPCETDNAVAELAQEAVADGLDEEMRLRRWLELWFLAVGTVVRL